MEITIPRPKISQVNNRLSEIIVIKQTGVYIFCGTKNILIGMVNKNLFHSLWSIIVYTTSSVQVMNSLCLCVCMCEDDVYVPFIYIYI